MEKTFHGSVDFEALHSCEDFLRKAGFSFGSWQRGAPCGAMFGDYDISKWRNMTASERSDLHAIFSGDGRSGPITLTSTAACPEEGLRRLSVPTLPETKDTRA